MNARHIAYIVYLILMAIIGFVLATADIAVTRWQWWVITACIIGAYICGILRGAVT